jgi:hypothetical protein
MFAESKHEGRIDGTNIIAVGCKRLFDLLTCQKVKSQFHPRTSYEGPEGEWRCCCTLSSALDGGRWSTPRPGRFYGRENPAPIVQEAGWGVEIPPPLGRKKVEMV